jgi:cyanate permease
MEYPRRWAWPLLFLGSFSYTCLMFVWFSLPAFLGPITETFGLTATQAGVLTGAIPLTYVPIALFSGAIMDRVGSFRGVGGGLLLFGSAHLGRASAGDFPALLALTVLLGVGATTITFGMPKLVSEVFPADATGTPSSVYLLGSYLGTSGAFALGRPVLGPLLGGWRPVFRWSGVAVLAFAAVWWAAILLAPDPPESAADEAQSFDLASLRADFAAVFANRGMQLLVVVGSIYLLLTHGLQNWLATVLTARGVAPAVAATVTSVYVVSQAGGTVVLPPLSDRLGERRRMVMACAGIAAAGMAGLLVAGSALTGGLAVVAVGIGVGGLSPLVRMIPVELDGIGPSLTGTAVGLVFAVGEVGGFLGPFLVGALRDLTGSFLPGLAILGLGALAAFAAGSRLPV